MHEGGGKLRPSVTTTTGWARQLEHRKSGGALYGPWSKPPPPPDVPWGGWAPDGVARLVESESAVRAVIAMIEGNAHNVQVVSSACRAICSLALNTRNRVNLIRGEVHELLMKVIDVFSSDDGGFGGGSGGGESAEDGGAVFLQLAKKALNAVARDNFALGTAVKRFLGLGNDPGRGYSTT